MRASPDPLTLLIFVCLAALAAVVAVLAFQGAALPLAFRPTPSL